MDLMGSYTSDNDTYACDNQGCVLSCASPEFPPNTCYSLSRNFLDGTPCAGGGKCSNGNCEGSSAIKEVGTWIHQNKALVIGLATALGTLLIFIILGCIFRCCRRRTQTKQRPARHGAPPKVPQGWNGPPPAMARLGQGVWNGPMPPPVMSGANGNSGWGNPRNGPIAPQTNGVNENPMWSVDRNGAGDAYWGHGPPPPAYSKPTVRYA